MAWTYDHIQSMRRSGSITRLERLAWWMGRVADTWRIR